MKVFVSLFMILVSCQAFAATSRNSFMGSSQPVRAVKPGSSVQDISGNPVYVQNVSEAIVVQDDIVEVVNEPNDSKDVDVIDNTAEYYQKLDLLEQLKKQEQEIADNKRKCEKAKKNWKIATVVGSVGVVGTTVGVIVQHNQIQDKKEAIGEKQSEIMELQSQIDIINKNISNEI